MSLHFVQLLANASRLLICAMTVAKSMPSLRPVSLPLIPLSPEFVLSWALASCRSYARHCEYSSFHIRIHSLIKFIPMIPPRLFRQVQLIGGIGGVESTKTPKPMRRRSKFEIDRSMEKGWSSSRRYRETSALSISFQLSTRCSYSNINRCMTLYCYAIVIEEVQWKSRAASINSLSINVLGMSMS